MAARGDWCARSECSATDTSDLASEDAFSRLEEEQMNDAVFGVENFRRSRDVFTVVRRATADELEERYSRKDKSLSQLSKRFLAEFGLESNQLISMFEVTDRLRTFVLPQALKGEGFMTSSTSSRVWALSPEEERTTTSGRA